MLKLINITGILLLLVLLRKLCWWKRGRELPAPIGWLPGRDGSRFAAHVEKHDKEE